MMMRSDVNLTEFHDVPASSLAPVLDRAYEASDEQVLRSVTALLRNRALRLLRSGSRTELRDEAFELNRFLHSKKGKEFGRRHPDVHTRQAAIADLISEAARRTDTMSVEAILRSYKRYGRRLLEALERSGERPVERSALRAQLELSESHLSHMLSDFEDAEVIVRRRSGKEVFVTLGPVGREIVRQSLAPEWIDELVQTLLSVATGGDDLSGKAPAEMMKTLSRRLVDKGMPSALVLDRFKPLFDLLRERGVVFKEETRELAAMR